MKGHEDHADRHEDALGQGRHDALQHPEGMHYAPGAAPERRHADRHEDVHGQADGHHRVLLTEVVHVLHRYVPEFIPWFRARLYCAGVRVARSPNLRRMMTDFLGRRWGQTTFAPSLIVLNSAFCGYPFPLEADMDVVCDMYFGLLDEHPELKFADW